jgi:hypothetical protein
LVQDRIHGLPDVGLGPSVFGETDCDCHAIVDCHDDWQEADIEYNCWRCQQDEDEAIHSGRRLGLALRGSVKVEGSGIAELGLEALAPPGV